MVAAWERGSKVVYAVRTRRKGDSLFKRVTARVFYRTLSRLSDVEVPLDSGDFRLMDRQVVEVLGQMRESSRYVRGLVSWIGFPQVPVFFERDERAGGATKYGLRKMLGFASDGLTAFSEKPLRISTRAGAAITGLSLAVLVWLIIGYLVEPSATVPGWTSLSVAVLFLGGVQLLSIGILGAYIGRIYQEVKGRPLYVTADPEDES
jgi:dolichol-phosphate mannosyltransferase